MTVTDDPGKRGFALLWEDLRGNARLREDWHWVLTKSWSVRFIVLAAILSGLEVAIQVAIAWQVKPPIPPGIFAALSGLVTVAACAARFFAQQKDA
jgi:hypothetical protein